MPATSDELSRARRASLERYEVLDTPDEELFDGIARMASAICRTPVALVTMLDGERHWSKAAVGTEGWQTPVEHVFCVHALTEGGVMEGGVMEGGVMEVTDAARDGRFATDPLVSGHPFLRFYAGAAYTDREGLPIGTVCVFDTEPRTLTAEQKQLLAMLARQVAALLELRLTQVERRREDERNRDIIESAVDYAIITADSKGVIESWNAGAERVLGWAAAEVVGRPLEMIFTPEDRAAGIPSTEIANVLAYDRGLDERWHVRKDGSRFWASGELLRLKTDRDEYRGFVKILRDRTAHRLLELDLKASQQALEMAQAAGSVGTFSVDIGTDRITCSTEFARIFGLELQEVSTIAEVQETILPEDRHLASNAGDRAAAGGDEAVEYRIRRRSDGEVRWIARQGRYGFDGGRPVSLYGVVRDITEQKRAEQQRELAIGEMAHRLGNTLAMVQAIAAQTLRGVADRARIAAFEQRILSLNSAHVALLRKDWDSAALDEILRGVLEALGVEGRVRVAGPPVSLGPRSAMTVSLMLHELSTNALKYGALSREEGTIGISWRMERDADVPVLRFSWRESGGPPVHPPTRKGFGSRLLAMGFGSGGKVDIRYEPTGLEIEATALIAELTH